MSNVTRIPAYIMDKIERANMYARKSEALSCEVEQWMEAHGCEDACEALSGYREPFGMVTRITEEELLAWLG